MYQGLGQMLTKCLQHHQGCPETPKSADVICERPLRTEKTKQTKTDPKSDRQSESKNWRVLTWRCPCGCWRAGGWWCSCWPRGRTGPRTSGWTPPPTCAASSVYSISSFQNTEARIKIFFKNLNSIKWNPIKNSCFKTSRIYRRSLMNCEQNSYKIMVNMVTGVDLSYGSWHYPSFLLNRKENAQIRSPYHPFQILSPCLYS